MNTRDITVLLEQASSGDRDSADQVLALVYGQLKTMASARMRSEAANHTLQPTALVHEVWFKIMGGKETRWRQSKI